MLHILLILLLDSKPVGRSAWQGVNRARFHCCCCPKCPYLGCNKPETLPRDCCTSPSWRTQLWKGCSGGITLLLLFQGHSTVLLLPCCCRGCRGRHAAEAIAASRYHQDNTVGTSCCSSAIVLLMCSRQLCRSVDYNRRRQRGRLRGMSR